MTASYAGVPYLITFVVWASAVVVPAPARAADVIDIVGGIQVAAPECPDVPLSVPAFMESLRVELANRAATSTSGPTLVTLAIEPCDPGTTRVQITIADQASGRTLVRDVGLEDVTPDARPRALALAVAELVRGAQPPPAPVLPVPVVSEAGPAPRTEARSAAFALAADAVLSLFPNRKTVLWGGRLSLSIERGRWQLGAFADAAAGERTYDVGRVAVQSFGAGLAAGPRWTWGRVTLSPGVVGALGWTRIQGHAAEPDVDAGAGAAVTAAVRARVAAAVSVGRGFSVRGLVEGGFMARSFDATVDGLRAAGLSGTSIVIGVGIGFGGQP
jgi:hypothetical protein